MLDRNKAPLPQKIQNIDFVRPQEIWINSSVKLLWMQNVPNDTSRIDLYFDAGLRKGRNIIASLCSSLLFSGTKEKNTTEIHNQIDQLGAFFDIGLSHEGVLVSVFALKENIYEAFCVIYNAIQGDVFPDKEIIEKITGKKEKHKINSGKVGFLAQRKFQEKIFYNTPYSELTNLEDYDNVTKKELVEFHKSAFKNGLYKVAVVGNLKEKEVESIVKKCKNSCIDKPLEYYKNFCNSPGIFHIEKKSAVQSAIRIGKTLFNKTHEDFFDFSILNTVLGDYFGSRLMKNIREDKGFTYGIGSALAETGGSGYFIIGSEVGIQHRQPTLNEVQKELETLCSIQMEQNELNLVKNYLLGQMLKSADGPYAMMDLFLSVDAYSLDMDFYNQYIERIHQIDTNQIKSISNKHLQWETMSVVSAG
jgi:predicted Zn-dependent peptidase